MAHGTVGTSPYLVGHLLKDLTFPAPQRDVLHHARERGASEALMRLLRGLADREYRSRNDVIAAVADLE